MTTAEQRDAAEEQFEREFEELWSNTFGYSHVRRKPEQMPKLLAVQRIVRCLCCKRLMRSAVQCRGCWKVFYCGKGCQTKHWKKEHRQVCLWSQFSHINEERRKF